MPANRKETTAASAPTSNPTLVQMTQIKRQQVFEEKLDEESSELEKMRPFNAAKQYIHRIVDVNLLVSNMSRLAGYATRGDVFTSTEVRIKQDSRALTLSGITDNTPCAYSSWSGIGPYSILAGRALFPGQSFLSGPSWGRGILSHCGPFLPTCPSASWAKWQKTHAVCVLLVGKSVNV